MGSWPVDFSILKCMPALPTLKTPRSLEKPKEVDVEVVRGSVGDQSGALVTGFELHDKITFIFQHPFGLDTRAAAMAQTVRRTRQGGGYTMASGCFKKAYLVDCKGHQKEGQPKQQFVFKLSSAPDCDLLKDCEDSEKAVDYATAFNVDQRPSAIKFCAPVLVEVKAARDKNGVTLTGWAGKEAMVEPHLKGTYDKFVFDEEYPAQQHELAQAFFHFTYYRSKGREIIWDLQGVNCTGAVFGSEYRLTDPYIVDDEAKAKEKFLKLHKHKFGCNKHCPGLSRWHGCFAGGHAACPAFGALASYFGKK